MKQLGLIVCVAAILGWSAALGAGPSVAPSDVRVSPMHIQGSQVRYPRLVAFPDPAVQKRVNALLAQREAEREQQRVECHNTFRDTKQKTSKQSFKLVIAASYVSSRYLSLDIKQSEYCGGPYPDVDVPDPLTIDLGKGAPIDWKAVFKPGVLPDPQAAGRIAPQFLAMYQARYVKDGSKEPACQDAVKNTLTSLTLWLDSKRGLVAAYDFPHAAQVCAVEIAFLPNQLAPVVTPGFLADLKATVAAQDVPPKKSTAR